MKIENQVCSLDLAKKLKELGVKQESLFWYKLYGWNVPDAEFELLYGDPWNYENKFINPEVVSAFTVAELGEMLPVLVEGKRLETNKLPRKDWFVSYVPFNKKERLEKEITTYGDTEANARAKMLIYLLENKLIKL